MDDSREISFEGMKARATAKFNRKRGPYRKTILTKDERMIKDAISKAKRKVYMKQYRAKKNFNNVSK